MRQRRDYHSRAGNGSSTSCPSPVDSSLCTRTLRVGYVDPGRLTGVRPGGHTPVSEIPMPIRRRRACRSLALSFPSTNDLGSTRGREVATLRTWQGNSGDYRRPLKGGDGIPRYVG
eukprot:11604664-Heterocapsa_arctica.AAC.1